MYNVLGRRIIILNIGIIFIAFISVNLDFFFLLIFLLRKHRLKDVIIGYSISTLLILVLSYIIGFTLLKIFPEWLLGIMGIIPIYLAFHDDDDENKKENCQSSILDVIVTYFSICLGCNLSVFLPILINENIVNFMYTLAFVVILTIIATVIIKIIMNNNFITKFIDNYGEIAMKICYIFIGVYVFFDSGLIEHIYKILIY